MAYKPHSPTPTVRLPDQTSVRPKYGGAAPRTAIGIALGIAIALCLVTTPSHGAKVYKVIDKDGNVTYTNRRPVETDGKQMKIPRALLNDTGAKDKLDALTGKADDLRKDRESKASGVDAIRERDERIKKNCEIAKENMRVLDNASRVQVKDGEGNPSFLDDAARAARKTKTQEQIERFCNS